MPRAHRGRRPDAQRCAAVRCRATSSSIAWRSPARARSSSENVDSGSRSRVIEGPSILFRPAVDVTNARSDVSGFRRPYVLDECTAQPAREANMFRFVLVGVAALALATPAAAAPCRDIPTVWTLSSTFVDSTTSSRIYSDGASYTDGGKGVSATIKLCSGTNDAVLVVTSGRSIMFNLGDAFLGPGSTAAPAWTSGAAFASPFGNVKSCGGSPCTLLNVRNILDSGAPPRNAYYKLYTRLDSALVAPDKKSYHLPLHNPDTCTDAVACDSNDGLTNSPFVNARVVVEHFPASESVQEYWLVYPESPSDAGSMSPSPQNGALLSNDRTINYGQFSLPFYFVISVK